MGMVGKAMISTQHSIQKPIQKPKITEYAIKKFKAHLVFSLARHFRTRENNTQILPQWILLNLLPDEVPNTLRNAKQELRSRSDTIGVECPRVRIGGIGTATSVGGYDALIFRGLGQVLGGTEAT